MNVKEELEDIDQNTESNGSLDDLELENKEKAFKEKIKELDDLISEQNDKILRISAEVENIRKRSKDEITKTRKFAIESFAENMVLVKDSLEAALSQKNQSVDSLIEGVSLTLKQLDSVFRNNMLNEINPTVGDKFDPNLHQAISSLESHHPANTIIEILQKGYIICERVIRPALVVVSSSSNKQ